MIGDEAIGVREEAGVRIVEGTPGAPVMRRPQDAILVLEACFSAPTRVALLYPENLTPRFFDLSSGEAGEILDTFRRFRVLLDRLRTRHSPVQQPLPGNPVGRPAGLRDV